MKPNWKQAPRWARYLICACDCWYWMECKPSQIFRGVFNGRYNGEYPEHHRSRFAGDRFDDDEQTVDTIEKRSEAK